MPRLLTLLIISVSLQAQDWTDRAEYDMALAVRAQSAAAQRLPLLDQWKQKYPNSAVRQLRSELSLAAAQSLGDTARMLDIARELTSVDANHFGGLYWITLLAPANPSPAAGALTEAESAAKRMAKNADAFFASPAGKTAGPQQKTATLALAHRALGWVEWRRGSLDAAEKEMLATLHLTPRNAELSAWLGSVLAVQKPPERQIQAIWHLARAAFLDGEGALPPAPRRDVRALLEAAYSGYHGSLDGLEEIGGAARGAVTPPTGFKVETAAEMAQRKADEEMEKTNPQLFTWVKIRRRLEGPDADAEYRKLADGPPLPLLKGYVIRCDADPKPTEAIVGLQDTATEEVVLKFDAALARCAEVGVAVEFSGKPVELVRQPFRLSVAVVGTSIQGWPEPPAKPEKKD